MKKKIMTATILMLVLSTAGFAGSKSHDVHWAYGGETGPDSWVRLSDEYASCGGSQQSPINITEDESIDAGLGDIKISYTESTLKLVNNGHTIQANYDEGSSMTINGKKYDLLQFHFHTPSEHKINDKASDMELHFVHKNKQSGELAVIGVMMDSGSANKALQILWDNIPKRINHEVVMNSVKIDASALLPRQTGRYYHYQGSLTTPPCSEIVNWYVLKDSIQVSDPQVARFAELIGDNARPVQEINRRFVLVND